MMYIRGNIQVLWMSVDGSTVLGSAYHSAAPFMSLGKVVSTELHLARIKVFKKFRYSSLA
jgi:hypothetical protein